MKQEVPAQWTPLLPKRIRPKAALKKACDELAQHATDEWRGLYGQGRALYRIREEQLYRECDPAFDDFRDFIEGALGMSNRWAYHRIDTYLVIDNLVAHNKQTGKNLPLPNNERQCRELAKLDHSAEDQALVWETAVASNGEVTAKVVADARKAYLESRGTPEAKPAPKNWSSAEFYRAIDTIANRLDRQIVERSGVGAWGKKVARLLNEAVVEIPRPPEKKAGPPALKFAENAKEVTCKKCGEAGLAWGTTRLGKRVLGDRLRGTMHRCT